MQQVTLSRFAMVSLVACTVGSAQDPVDLVALHAIKSEAFEHSQVMDTASWLTDVYGPRLTASPEFQQAANWAVGRLKSWGLSNVHTESWGPFGRGWSLKHYSVELLEPRYALLDAMPLAWSTPTNKPVEGELVMAPYTPPPGFNQAKANEAFDTYKKEWTGKLRGKILLYSVAGSNANSGAPSLKRYTDTDLAELAKAPDPAARTGRKGAEAPPTDPAALAQLITRREEAAARRAQFFIDEGVVGILQVDARSHEGMAFAEAAGPYKMKGPLSIPQFRLTAEHYNRLVRLLEKKQATKVRIDLEAVVGDQDLSGQNIVAELPGMGPHKDEIVMIGAHFDSWHGGTGATDNAAGSAAMMEVLRILKTLNLKTDRTVRMVLWSGEEEGLLGSKAYVKEHFGTATSPSAQQAKVTGYFNLDNGSGKIRGVYLQGNDAMRPMFEKWLAPFQDLGVTTISIRNTGGTDHLSLDAVGIPGFQFIQEPLDYFTVTHHSSMDTYDHLIAADLMQASAVIASVVYDAANTTQMLPRKPLPLAPATATSGQ
jgi:carboxypeptidase Q